MKGIGKLAQHLTLIKKNAFLWSKVATIVFKTVLGKLAQPISFSCNAFLGKHRSFFAYDGELALVIGLKRWRQYLLGTRFVKP